MKLISPVVVLAAAVSVGVLAFGCSQADTFAPIDADGGTGSVRMDVQLGEVTVTSATAVLSGRDGFPTQTRTIDISGDAGVVSIFFDGLPVGQGYRAQMTAGSCGGSSTFEVFADQTTVADVTLDCGGSAGDAGPAPCLAQGRASIECVDGGVGPTCGDGLINQSNEQCDGTAFPPLAHPNSVCSPSCQLLTVICTCGDGVICPFEEQCDGSTLPTSAPAGTSCSVTCTLVAPPLPDACGTCAEANCALQRASVDASFAAVAPILDCVLGPSWEGGGRASEDSCANEDLLTCYCGTVAGEDCVDREPGSLDGPCVDQVLTGTDCASSSCVAPIFLNPANANGNAMQYAQCRQDFCYEVCFNP